MPAQVLYDSEDEEEDLLREDQRLDESPDGLEHIEELDTAPSRPQSQVEVPLHEHQWSPAQLRSDMPHAERDMRAVRSDLEASLATSNKLKRRHSELSSETRSVGTVQGRLKRMRSARESATYIDQGASDGLVIGHGRPIMSTAARFEDTPQSPDSDSCSNRPGPAIFGNSGDTLPYTEQTQQVMHEMVAHTKNTRLLGKQTGSSNTELSFPWTANESSLSARNEAADDSLQQAALQPPVVLTQGSPPDEAAQMIEQYLENHQIGKGEEYTTSYLVKAENSTSRPDRLLLELAQGSQDVLGSPVDHSHKKSKQRSQSRRTTEQHQAHTGHEANSGRNMPERSPGTINPAILQLPETTVNPFATQTSMEDEIILAKPRSKHEGTTTTTISMDKVIELLKDRPVLVTSEASQAQNTPEQEQQFSLLPDPSLAKPPRAKRGSKKKSKRCHTTIFEDHVELQQKQDFLTLSQQQAQRKAALEELQDVANKPSGQRGRHKVVLEEDEHIEMQQSTLSVLDKPEPVESNIVDENQSDVATVQQEKGKRSITRKAKVPVRELGTAQPQRLESGKQNAELDSQAELSSHEPQHTPPEQLAEVPAQMNSLMDARKMVDLNSSPTTHSPIKPNGTVSFRVGLSRRQRIPSLLRVVRPTKTS